MTKPKVLVAMLNMGTTVVGWETQVFQWMAEKSKDYEFKITFPSKRPIPSNRNTIVKEFLAGDWDFLVMLDDDNPCHKNIFDLLDLNLPVVGGIYPGRDNYGIMFHVYKALDTDPPTFRVYPPEEREGLRKVDAIGTGLIVIKREVIEKVLTLGPAFEDIIDKDGVSSHSEDMGFCIKCKKLGIDVYAHYDYIGSHWKDVDLLWVANLVAYAARTGKTNFPHE